MDRRTALALALALVVFALFTALQARYAPKRPLRLAADSRTGAPVIPGAPGRRRVRRARAARLPRPHGWQPPARHPP